MAAEAFTMNSDACWHLQMAALLLRLLGRADPIAHTVDTSWISEAEHIRIAFGTVLGSI